MFACACVNMDACCVSATSSDDRRVIHISRSGVTGSCEQSAMGFRSPTQAICKDNKPSLIPESAQIFFLTFNIKGLFQVLITLLTTAVMVSTLMQSVV